MAELFLSRVRRNKKRKRFWEGKWVGSLLCYHPRVLFISFCFHFSFTLIFLLRLCIYIMATIMLYFINEIFCFFGWWSFFFSRYMKLILLYVGVSTYIFCFFVELFHGTIPKFDNTKLTCSFVLFFDRVVRLNMSLIKFLLV